MARGSGRVKPTNPITNALQEVVGRHWKSLPAQAKTFLLESPSAIDIHGLANFWSNPKVVEHTRGGNALAACGASWFIALAYLKNGREKEAMALTLNGSFLRQCAYTPIETIVALSREKTNAPIKDFNLPTFYQGFQALQTRKTMEGYLHEKLSAEHQDKLHSFVKTQSDHVIGFVDKIGDEWSGSTKRNRRQKRTPKISTETETQIQLFLVDETDGTNGNGRHGFSIGSSTTLKVLFNDYADKRGVSLRSLRFSYNGKTLFLSAIGNKTPSEVDMQDQDIITVHDTNVSQDAGSGSSKQKNLVAPKSIKTKKKSAHKAKSKGKKKKQIKCEKPVKTLGEYRTQHSNMLSKLHEELQPRLKEIRMRLNALGLERKPPKQRRSSKKKKGAQAAGLDHDQMLPNVGGKAGKPYFLVNVGEVQNLYKTTKPSQQSSPVTSTLDLHGCTRDEALERLSECLGAWEDTAMQGLYPFVIPAKIVCGCGSQVLSETVEKWIRAHAQVANAPKNWIQ